MYRSRKYGFLLVLLVALLQLKPSMAWAQDAKVIGPDTPVQPGKPVVVEMVSRSKDLEQVAAIDQGESQLQVTLNANVAFDKDRAELKPEANRRMSDIVAKLKSEPGGVVTIKGYTDNLGSRESGVDLSNRRANAVKSALSPQLPGFQLEAEGLAEANPVAPNDTEENRAKNRRVEISFRRPAEQRPAQPSPAPPSRPPADGSQARVMAGKVEVSTDEGNRYAVEARPVVTRNKTASAQLTITTMNETDRPVRMDLNFLREPGYGRRSGPWAAPDGIVLIDNKENQELWPDAAPDKSNLCFTRPNLLISGGDFKKVNFTCWYAVPAGDRVDIRVGSAGVIKDVPVL